MRAKPPGERTTVKEMATQYGCPHDVLARVLQKLANRSVLQSEQGAHGGYSISKDLNRVSFHELLEMILGPMALARCIHESGAQNVEAPCELRGTCNIVSPIQLLNRKMNEFYKSLSVAELIEAGRPSKVDRAARAPGAEA